LVSGKGMPFPYKMRFIEGHNPELLITMPKVMYPIKNGDVSVSIFIATIWLLAEISSLQTQQLKWETPPQVQVRE
jgi:hypothetical protein